VSGWYSLHNTTTFSDRIKPLVDEHQLRWLS